MTGQARIEVENVSVLFPLYHGNSRSLKKMLVAAASGRLGQDQQQRVVVRALQDVSLRLESGDRLGLVGSNGAGKTTLLRVLAGIYEPVAGRLRVQGSLNALLDPSLGMNMELTGRENILLRGLYNGLPRSMLPRLEDDVAESDPLAIVYTSGSTSAPKGVVHTHGGLLAHQRNLNAIRCLTADDRLFCNSPFFWIGGFGFALLATLLAGCTLVWPPSGPPMAHGLPGSSGPATSALSGPLRYARPIGWMGGRYTISKPSSAM